MFENIWWVFVIVGVILVIFEIFTPGFIIMWFGIASIIAAIPVYFNTSTTVVIFVYAATLLVLTVFVRKITINFLSKSSKDVKTNVSGLVGKKAIVIEEIDSVAATGRVRVDREVWTAISENGEVILEKQTVIVSKVDGVKLIIREDTDQWTLD